MPLKQRAYFRELRAIVAQSEPVENVAVVKLQLFSLPRAASAEAIPSRTPAAKSVTHPPSRR